MPIESASYPSALDPTNYGPESTGPNSDPTEGALYIKNIREILLNTFANLSGPVTATHTELNYTDIATLGTAEASKCITVSAGGVVIASGITWADLGAVTTVDINGGTIDGTVIGGTTPAAGSFTTLSASGNVTFTGGTVDGIPIGGTTAAAGAFTTLSASTSLVLASGATVTAILDEDDMVSDSATALVTQQSIKKYVDDRTHVVVLSHVIADVSTAETIYVPVPVAGTITRMDTTLEGPITVADALVRLHTFDDNLIASNTIAFTGSAAGDADADTSPSNPTVAAGAVLKLSTDGASTGSARVWVAITIQSTVS